MRLLLIDDDPECLQACAAELTEAGHELLCFDSFREMRSRGLEGIDVAILDLELPGESAPEAMAWLKQQAPDLPIVALTSHAGDDYIFAALKAGAVGYVLKHDALGTLARVVAETAAGGAPMTPRIARRVLAAFREAPWASPSVEPRQATVHPPPEVDGEPTPRELQVLEALARGLTYEQCGAALDIRVDTVRTYVRSIYRKLHVASKAEAVVSALRLGWLS